MKYFAAFAVVVGLSFFAASPANAQVSLSFGVNVGPAPACPYGYFDYAPYNCAPYGYYGPDWFPNRIFLGAGPWFHGPHGWHGYVDNRYDPHYGYHGEFPHRGEHGEFHGYGHGHEFHGNSSRGGYENHGGDHGNHENHGGDHGDHGDNHGGDHGHSH
jgi:hypothetical protein